MLFIFPEVLTSDYLKMTMLRYFEIINKPGIMNSLLQVVSSVGSIYYLIGLDYKIPPTRVILS